MIPTPTCLARTWLKLLLFLLLTGLVTGARAADGKLPPSKRINLACVGVGGRANSVIPGLIATEWRESWAETAAETRHQSKQDFLNRICADWGIVAGRWGGMDEVADAVVFLASDRAAYINGAKLTVDGIEYGMLGKRAQPVEYRLTQGKEPRLLD